MQLQEFVWLMGAMVSKWESARHRTLLQELSLSSMHQFTWWVTPGMRLLLSHQLHWTTRSGLPNLVRTYSIPNCVLLSNLVSVPCLCHRTVDYGPKIKLKMSHSHFTVQNLKSTRLQTLYWTMHLWEFVSVKKIQSKPMLLVVTQLPHYSVTILK